jgi:hypothetical protein
MATKKYYTIPHPRCNDIHIKIPKKNESITIIDNSQDLTIQAEYPGQLSLNTQRILKKIQHRAYYRAINLLSAVSNQSERNFLLQLLISLASCLQNNYDANIVKIWVDNVSIQEHIKSNSLINATDKNKGIKISHLIELKMGVTSQLLIDEEEIFF